MPLADRQAVGATNGVLSARWGNSAKPEAGLRALRPDGGTRRRHKRWRPAAASSTSSACHGALKAGTGWAGADAPLDGPQDPRACLHLRTGVSLLQWVHQRAAAVWPSLSIEEINQQLGRIQQFELVYPRPGEKEPLSNDSSGFRAAVLIGQAPPCRARVIEVGVGAAIPGGSTRVGGVDRQFRQRPASVSSPCTHSVPCCCRAISCSSGSNCSAGRSKRSCTARNGI